jgi:cytochrome c biogenesis protein CcmG/thiol:disulfide interchange protein DsbE
VLLRSLSVVLLLLASACQGKGSEPAELGAEAPRFTGKTIEGEYVALEDYRGKVVLLNVWATWCGPCRQELPELAALHQQFGGDGFTVLGVSIDTERDFKKVQAMAEQYRLRYPIVFDPSGSSIGLFDVVGYPTSILVGKNGEIRWRRNGLIRPGDDDVHTEIKAAIAAPL